jgi:hypothetical protein
MVCADYAAAERECAVLAPLTHELQAIGCSAYVEATTGVRRRRPGMDGGAGF